MGRRENRRGVAPTSASGSARGFVDIQIVTKRTNTFIISYSIYIYDRAALQTTSPAPLKSHLQDDRGLYRAGALSPIGIDCRL